MPDLSTFTLASTIVAVLGISIGVMFPAIAMGWAISRAMEALSRLSADEEVSRSLYRMGFRSLDEVLDASEGELASVPGISADDVAQRREDAGRAKGLLRRRGMH